MPVDFSFFAIQPGGNFGLQSDPLRHEANTAGKRHAIDAQGTLGTNDERVLDREGHGLSRAARANKDSGLLACGA
jgi:hypothetical protein